MLRRFLSSHRTAAAAAACTALAVNEFLLERKPSSALFGMTSSKYELKYFDGKGAVEISRYVLALSGTKYTDTRWKMDMSKPYGQRCEGFMNAKASGDLAANLDRAPILLVDGVAIGESKAIERFLAKRTGLMGANDVESALVDSFCEHIRDIKSNYDKAADKAKFLSEALPSFLGKMEREAASGKAVVGNSASLADVALYELMTDYFPAREAYLRGKGEGGGVTIDAAKLLKDCPKLSAAVDAIKTHPGVAKHVANRNYSAPW